MSTWSLDEAALPLSVQVRLSCRTVAVQHPLHIDGVYEASLQSLDVGCRLAGDAVMTQRIAANAALFDVALHQLQQGVQCPSQNSPGDALSMHETPMCSLESFWNPQQVLCCGHCIYHSS